MSIYDRTKIPEHLLQYFDVAEIGSEASPDCLGWARGFNCAEKDWGAACHVCRMVLVMRELRRVLRDDGTLWMNYGDSYSSGGSTRKAGGGVFDQGRTDGRPGDGGKERWKEGHNYEIPVASRKNQDHRSSVVHKEGYKSPFRGGTAGDKAHGSPYLEQGPMTGGSGLPAGNLVGVPWRVALAMQADGWILRQDIIWHKPSPMPESVRNRCTKAHEYVFLFSKRQQYFYDMESVKESSTSPVEWIGDSNDYYRSSVGDVTHTPTRNHSAVRIEEGRRNRRSVWTISSQGYEGAHFATFPVALIEPMIKAGTSEKGACAKCGAPWRRVVEEKQLTRERPNEFVKYAEERGIKSGKNLDRNDLGRSNVGGTRRTPGQPGGSYSPPGQAPHSNARGVNSCSNTVAGVETKTVGWEPTCPCFGKFVKEKRMVVGHGSYHDHSQDGVEHGLRQGGNGPASVVGEPTKEFERVVSVYVPDIPLEDHPIVPCTTLDPFLGSGTTAAVSLSLGRRSVGIDLSQTYLEENAIPRIEGAILQRPALKKLIVKDVKKVNVGKRLETKK